MSAGAASFADRVFLTRKRTPKLVHCAVLFVDLLGVRAMNRGHHVTKHLRALDRAVTRTYRDFLEADSPWPAAFFSDTFVLAAPVAEHGGEESAIGGLVLQAALLQLDLLAAGFFVRGGLSLGEMHIRDGLVFGPALVEAYELESTRAVSPRIVLSPDVEACQRADLRNYENPAHSPQSSMLLCDSDGQTFINYLGLLLIEPDDPRRTLQDHRDTVHSRLQLHRGEKPVWEKYRWVAEYHNAVVSRALPGEPELHIDQGTMTWPFNRFA